MMVYAIFEVEKAKISKTNEILKDDVVSRQSISIRDASAVGVDRNVQFIIIEGDAPSLDRAEKLFKGEMKARSSHIRNPDGSRSSRARSSTK
jgi:hypothetical protein